MAEQKPSSPKGRSGSGAGSAMRHLGGEARPSAAGARRQQRKEHLVLVVDDDPAARYATARMLQDAGFTVKETGSGYDALALAEAADAVVLDVNLPDVNGVKVCDLIKAHPATRTVPVLLHSAVYDDELHREAGLAAGADAYFVAPLQPEVLIPALDKVLSVS